MFSAVATERSTTSHSPVCSIDPMTPAGVESAALAADDRLNAAPAEKARSSARPRTRIRYTWRAPREVAGNVFSIALLRIDRPAGLARPACRPLDGIRETLASCEPVARGPRRCPSPPFHSGGIADGLWSPSHPFAELRSWRVG